MEINLQENERLDDLECNGMHILSNKNLYCFTSDAVMLANLVRANSSQNVIDLCSGSGIIALLISAKTRAKNIDCVEIQSSLADMCTRSIELNGLSERIKVINSNLVGIEAVLGSNNDIVVCNPPYYKLGSGATRVVEEVAMARHEITCTLEDIIKTSAKLLKFGGKLYMVHKCERLNEVLTLFTKYCLEPKELITIQTSISDECDTFIVIAKKGAKSGLKVKTIKHE